MKLYQVPLFKFQHIFVLLVVAHSALKNIESKSNQLTDSMKMLDGINHNMI